jgi:long-chain acyl-CoA synthetase
VAKGAMLSHGNMVANVLQVAAWMSPGLNDGAETVVIPLPLYHVFALTGCLSFFSKGAQIVLIATRATCRRSSGRSGRRASRHHRREHAVPRPARRPASAQVDWSRLKLAVAGGMAVQQVVAQRWKQTTGVPLVEGYGLTESAPVAIANPVTIEEWSGRIGVPLPSTEAAILDDDGRPLALGEVGEICLRGPQVMKGYWRRPEETANVFTADGWLRTGDMGVMDERGDIRLTDRKKDMIVVSGFKVFPNEIEDVLATAPRRGRGRRHRRARRALGRGGQGGGAAQGPGTDRSRAARALQAAPDRLQGAAHRRVPHRAAAEDQHRQDPAAGTA